MKRSPAVGGVKAARSAYASWWDAGTISEKAGNGRAKSWAWRATPKRSICGSRRAPPSTCPPRRRPGIRTACPGWCEPMVPWEFPSACGKRWRTMDEIVASTTADSRFDAWLCGIFAGVALLLTATGIYGLLSFSVARRTGEIGTRLALGASPTEVLKLVLGQGM